MLWVFCKYWVNEWILPFIYSNKSHHFPHSNAVLSTRNMIQATNVLFIGLNFLYLTPYIKNIINM